MSSVASRVRVPLLVVALVAVLLAPPAWPQQASCIPGVTATVDPPCAPQGTTVTLTVHNGSSGGLTHTQGMRITICDD